MGHVDYSQACPVAERGGSVQQRYCGNCGNDLPEGVRFCGSPDHATACVPTPETDAQAPPPPAPEPRRRGVGHTILGVALLLCGIVCLLMVLLARTLYFLFGPIPNMAFAGLFIGRIGLACLYGACRCAASPIPAHRLTGSGASAYLLYLPSTLPTITSTGKTKRCTTAGISAM
jgi:hypothetical protein